VKIDQEKPEVDETKAPTNAAEEIAQIELQIKKAQLADLELQKRERELNLDDLRVRIGDRETKAKQKKQDREQQGRTFAQQRAAKEAQQRICTHRKGGMINPRDLSVLSTGGNSNQYAVIKHQMINGDMWVLCLRCGKVWVPPVKDNFYFKEGRARNVAPKDGKFSQEKFDKASQEYRDAVQFPTGNSSSASVPCKFTKWDEKSEQWVDASQEYRQFVKNSDR